MAININGKFAASISVVSLLVALLVGGMNYGMIASATAANTNMISVERQERIEADSQMRAEWLFEIRGLNQRIDRLLEKHLSATLSGVAHD